VVVLGGGPVGTELGQFLRRFGVEVTIVQGAPRLLEREEPAASELLGGALREDGVELRLDVQAEAVKRANGRCELTLSDGAVVSGEKLLVATGRRPRLPGGLEQAGIEAGKRGIEVDERCRAEDGVWAIGDVTGAMPFTHVAKYQGRIAAQDLMGRPARVSYAAIPRVVFTDPEVAAVGLTTAQAREQGIELVTSRIKLPEVLARPWTYEQNPRGELGLLADREHQVLVGAWAVAPLAGEWIHQAALAIKAELPLAMLRDTVAQFPTFSEGYLMGLEALAPSD
jgi:dihydrolipoamide dehydrogenase